MGIIYTKFVTRLFSAGGLVDFELLDFLALNAAEKDHKFRNERE